MVQNRIKILSWAIIILLVLLLAAAFFIYYSNKKTGISNINNFEECAAAGYPVLESYPRQCRTPDGRMFTENVNSGEVLFEKIENGFGNSIGERQQVVIRTNKDWNDLWVKMGLHREAPFIDFDSEMVIAVFMGEKNSGGYSIEITKITDNYGIEATVREVSPGPGCIVTEAITQPYEIVKLERSDKEVRFILEQEIRDC